MDDPAESIISKTSLQGFFGKTVVNHPMAWLAILFWG